MAIYQLPGSNAVETAKAVRQRMKELSATFPPSITYSIPLDTTKAVTAGIHEIVLTLFEALGLVVIVVFIFLQGWRATLIPLLAVPVSLIGTFIIFPALGFSINTLSLFGLVLAIGLVVDDAIIVVEAVEHHIEEGMDPEVCHREGDGRGGRARRGDRADPGGRLHSDRCDSRHHRPAVSAVRGHHRDLRADLGVQCAHALPRALCASFKAQAGGKKQVCSTKGLRLFNRFFRRTTDSFVHASGVLIHKSAFAMLGLMLVGVAAVYLGSSLPSGFIPTEDQGYMFLALAASRRRFCAAHRRRRAENHRRPAEDARR